MAFGVDDATQVGTAIASTVGGIIDQTKRRQFEMNLAQLSNSQRNALEKELLKTQDATARLNILSNAMLQFAIENQKNVNDNETRMYWLAGGLATVLIVLAIFLVKSKK